MLVIAIISRLLILGTPRGLSALRCLFGSSNLRGNLLLRQGSNYTLSHTVIKKRFKRLDIDVFFFLKGNYFTALCFVILNYIYNYVYKRQKACRDQRYPAAAATYRSAPSSAYIALHFISVHCTGELILCQAADRNRGVGGTQAI